MPREGGGVAQEGQDAVERAVGTQARLCGAHVDQVADIDREGEACRFPVGQMPPVGRGSAGRFAESRDGAGARPERHA